MRTLHVWRCRTRLWGTKLMRIRACRVDRTGIEDRSRSCQAANCSWLLPCRKIRHTASLLGRGIFFFFVFRNRNAPGFSLKVLARYSSEIGICQFLRCHCRQFCTHDCERRWSDSTLLPPNIPHIRHISHWVFVYMGTRPVLRNLYRRQG